MSIIMETKEEIEFYSKMNKTDMKGLGDWIEHNITSPLHIKEVLLKLGLDDCGCEERQKLMNEIFPFKNKED